MDRSASVSREISSRDSGPWTESSVTADVMSVTTTTSSGRVCPPDHRLDPAMDDVARHDQEPLLVEAGDGEVGHDAAARVEPLGVDQPPDLPVDVAGGQPVEHRHRVGALHHELRHQAHVQHADGLADRPVLLGDDPERVRPGEVQP